MLAHYWWNTHLHISTSIFQVTRYICWGISTKRTTIHKAGIMWCIETEVSNTFSFCIAPEPATASVLSIETRLEQPYHIRN